MFFILLSYHIGLNSAQEKLWSNFVRFYYIRDKNFGAWNTWIIIGYECTETMRKIFMKWFHLKNIVSFMSGAIVFITVSILLSASIPMRGSTHISFVLRIDQNIFIYFIEPISSKKRFVKSFRETFLSNNGVHFCLHSFDCWSPFFIIRQNRV